MSDDDDVQQRQPAVRTLASVFGDSHHCYKEGDDEFAPNWQTLVTGVRVNRVLVAGTVTETTGPNENDYVQATINDPSGNVYVGAGQYQPDARDFLADIDPPIYVLAVGKPNAYSPEDSDDIYVNLRPEFVTEATKMGRDAALVEAAGQTLQQTDNFRAARDGTTEPTDEMERAMQVYDDLDLTGYEADAIEVLEQIANPGE